MNSPEDRIARLEILITEQETLLEKYSDLIRDQQNQISRLQARTELIELKLSRHEPGVEAGPGDEVPPHY